MLVIQVSILFEGLLNLLVNQVDVVIHVFALYIPLSDLSDTVVHAFSSSHADVLTVVFAGDEYQCVSRLVLLINSLIKELIKGDDR